MLASTFSVNAFAWLDMPTPMLHVEGRYLKNPDGENVTLRGGWMQPTETWFNGGGKWYRNPKDWTDPNDVAGMLNFLNNTADLMSDPSPRYGKDHGWYASFSRVNTDAIGGWTQENGLVDRTQFNAWIQNFVVPYANHLKSRGLYLILSATGPVNTPNNGSRNAGRTEQARLRTFWSTVANAPGVKNADNIMFELMNEPVDIESSPGNGDWGKGEAKYFSAFRDWIQPVINDIRDTGANNVIWVSTLEWQGSPQQHAQFPFTCTNCGVAAHYYPAYGGCYDNVDCHNRLWNRNYKPATDKWPMIITENFWFPEDNGLSSGSTAGYGNTLKANMEKEGNVSYMIGFIGDLLDNINNSRPQDANLSSKQGSQAAFEWWYQSNSQSDTCTPTTITPYVQVDEESWQQTASVTVDAGATVKFGPQPSSDNTWSWSGCGTSGSLREQTISPTDSCTVTATYTNSCGEQSTQDFTVNIDSVGNQAPVARTSGPYSAMIGAAVQFDASSSTDADGSIASYSWSFGDGSTGTGVKPTHSYSSQGTYNVTLTVTDNDNAVDSVMTNVDINPANQPPIADPGNAYSANDGEAVMFDGRGSSDPDGSIVSYAWNFGDSASSTEMNPSHTYAAAGSYTVSLTVTDNQGLTGTAMTSVTIGSVNMQAPVAQVNGPYSGSVAVPVDFSGSGSVDPDGTIVSYEWDFGDGNKMTDSSFSTSHAYSQSGIYTVTLKVTDNDGLMNMETTKATIGMGNVAPVAEARGPYRVKVNGVIKFNGSQSHDQDGSIINYIWDFGDGMGDRSNSPNPTHSYASEGTYNVILTVTDNTGAMDSDMTTVTVSSEGTDTGGSDESSSSAGAASVNFLLILTIVLSLSAGGRKEFLERDEVN